MDAEDETRTGTNGNDANTPQDAVNDAASDIAALSMPHAMRAVNTHQY
jgi:hypothetical protein